MADIPPRLKQVALSVTSVLMLVTGAIFVILLIDPGGSARDLSPAAPLPTPVPVATRAPDGPGFKTACRTFQSLYRNVESGLLEQYESRSARVAELNHNATFRGVPQEFTDDINAYTDGLDQKYGQGVYSAVGSIEEMEEIERRIRRRRDEILSECRTNQR